MQTDTPPILLIYGPTASGKSALALTLARSLDGEIINADSMQVYRHMPVLTAQPDAPARTRAPHHLYGVREPEQAGSAGWWLSAALTCIKAIQAQGKTPIVIGGTGLYLEALVKGLADIPAIAPAAQEEAKNILRAGGVEGLRTALEQVDAPAARRIQGADRQRLLRAMAVYLHTGQPLSAWQAQTKPALPPGAWRALVLAPGREHLHRRMAARFAHMLEAGALDEARTMAGRTLDPQLPAMKALGLRPLICHICGQIDLDTARDLALRDTRRYAKRQMTWARGRFAHWPRLDASQHGAADTEALRQLLSQKMDRRA